MAEEVGPEVCELGKTDLAICRLHFCFSTQSLRVVKRLVVPRPRDSTSKFDMTVRALSQQNDASTLSVRRWSAVTVTWLELDFVPWGTAEDLIAETMNQTRVLIILYGVACSLRTLHDHGIVHRAIRPSNILIDHLLEPVVADPGFIDLADDNALFPPSPQCGFTCPEILSESDYDAKADVYSYGMLIYAIETGRPPFDNPPDYRGTVTPILAGRIPPIPSKSPYAQLFETCTRRNPAERLDMAAVVAWLDERHSTLPGVDVDVFAEYKRRREAPAAGERGSIENLTEAAQTSPIAMYVLARLCWACIGVARDEQRAIELLNRAIDAGYTPAMEFLLSLVTEGAVDMSYDERAWLEAAVLSR